MVATRDPARATEVPKLRDAAPRGHGGAAAAVTPLQGATGTGGLFEQIIEAAPNAMVMVDADGRIVLVNAEAARLFGYARSELLCLSVDQLVPMHARGDHPAQRSAYAGEPRTRSMGQGRDLFAVRKDGSEVPVEIGLNPIEVAGRRFVLASVLDVTERKRHEDRFRRVVEASPSAMIEVDSDGKIVLVNTQAERLFGYRREEMLGQPMEMLLPHAVRQGHPDKRRHYMRGAESRAMGVGRDLHCLTKDGREVPVEIGLNPIQTEEGQFVLAAIIDITERKQLEQAQDTLHRSLEKQVAETRQMQQQQELLNRSLAAQVDETQKTLDRLRNAQDQLVQSEKMASLGGLVAGVAHEINTPVGIGVTAASHLQDEVQRFARLVKGGQLTRSALAEFVDQCETASAMIMGNLSRAAELIQSFKRVAVDQSSDGSRVIDFAGYVDEILLSLRPQLKHRPHKVVSECEAGIEFETVPGAWSQIITNLVMNAYTHGLDDARPGRVEIVARRDGERLLVRVSDDGRGIAPAHLGRVFEPFFTTRRAQGGTGLGLNVVFNLVSSTLGGRIQVDSAPGVGCTFSISVPLGTKFKEIGDGL